MFICIINRYLRVLASILFFVVFNTTFCFGAEDTEKSSDIREKPLPANSKPADWETSYTFTWYPEANLHATGSGKAGMNEQRLRGARNITITRNLTASAGLTYSLRHIDANSAARLPDNLHVLALDAGMTYRFAERGFASLRLSPGLHSDFNDIGTDDVRMPITTFAGYRFENGWSLVGGWVYRHGYNSNRIIPIAGFSYHPPGQPWQIDLMAPRPAITYLASPHLRLFVGGDFSSDEYELKDRTTGAKVIGYRDFRAGGGVDYSPVPTLKLFAMMGYAFDRKISFNDGTRSDVRLDNVPCMKIGVDIHW